jgi:hypothetical protein
VPSRRPADALPLVAELISTCLSTWTEPRTRRSYYCAAATAWSVSGAAAVLVVIIAWSETPGAMARLSAFGGLSLLLVALAGVLGWIVQGIGSVSVERATVLSAVAVVLVAVASSHILWQGRMLGYAFLLFGAARLGPATPLLARHAPEELMKRANWYIALWTRVLLVATIAAATWSLTIPIQYGGDMRVPPIRGPLAGAAIWLVGLLAIVLIGLPTAKRLMLGGLPSVGIDGRRRFFIRDFVITLAIASYLPVAVFGHLAGAPEIALCGLVAGLMASGIWEIFVHENVVLRGPGPIVWGPGALLIVAGIRLLVAGTPSSADPASAWLGAILSLLCGLSIEWYVLRKTLELKAGAWSSIRALRMQARDL